MLTSNQIDLMTAIGASCRHTIISMLKQSQSGHPGGSLSCIDYLTYLYTEHISQTGDPIIVSNGHISPAVYAILAELQYIPKQEVIDGFRKIGYPYEGHVTRHVPGVWYGTGPLGTGISAASGFALAEKIAKNTTKKIYGLVGDGECQEGQVYEMINFAKKYQLDNFIVFVDVNHVQLTDSIDVVMPVDLDALFTASGWHVIRINAHDMQDIHRGITEAHAVTQKPIVILGETIMGKGVELMEQTGRAHKADWHGKAPKPEQADAILAALTLTEEQKQQINTFITTQIKWQPKATYHDIPAHIETIDTGAPRVYEVIELTDCRSAYGNALLDLAKQNTSIVALTADLSESVKTNGVKEHIPERHIECGIAEQHMVSCAGGLSFAGYIPFCSTFGAFMTSRAKDQARVNDINHANVKMVATHCGLSVGEDGPTHQAIDDAGSMLGLLNTMQIEPADPNHCDRIIRFAAKTYGNIYVRMGRHKIPVLTKEDGSLLFPKEYVYSYGKTDMLRDGTDITIAAMGGTVAEALGAWKQLKDQGIHAEIIVISSIKQFDETIRNSVKKTNRVLTVEDHNTASGLGSQLLRHLTHHQIHVASYTSLGVDAYQLSGTSQALYKAANIDAEAITKTVTKILG
jgi:transketolase